MKPATHWRHQRISALFLLILLPWFFAGNTFGDLGASLKSFGTLTTSTGLCLLAVSLLYHLLLGLVMIVEDYISNPKTRALMINFLYALFCIVLIFIGVCMIKITAYGVRAS